MIMNKAFSSLLSPTGCAQSSDAKEKPFDEKAIRSRRDSSIGQVLDKQQMDGNSKRQKYQSLK